MSVNIALQPNKAFLLADSAIWRTVQIQVLAGTVYFGDDSTELENPLGGIQRGLGLTAASTQPPHKITFIGKLYLFCAQQVNVEVYLPQKSQAKDTPNAPGGSGSTIQVAPLIPFALMLLRFAGKFAGRLFLLLALIYAFSKPAKAQDQHVFYVGSNVTIVQDYSTSPLTSAAGVNFILQVQPNVSVTFYITNVSGSAFSMDETISTTGNVFATDVLHNAQYWRTVQTLVNGQNLSAGGAAQLLSISAGQTASVGVPMTQAAQLALNLNTASSGANKITVYAVVTPNGQVPINSIQGAQPVGATATTENPVYIAGSTGSNITGFQLDAAGHVILSAISTPNSFGFAQGATMLGSGLIPYMIPIDKVSNNITIGGTSSTSEWHSGVTESHTAVATASGNTPLWPAATAEAWRIVCVSVDVTANATLTTAGIETIQLEEATATIGFRWDVFIPASGTANAYHSESCNPGPGVAAQGLSDALNINLSTALATGEVVVRVSGTQY